MNHFSGILIIFALCLTGAHATADKHTLSCQGTLIANQGSDKVPYQVNVKIVANFSNILHENSTIAVSPIDSGWSNVSETNKYDCQVQSCPPGENSPCTCAETSPQKFPELSLTGEFLGNGPFRGSFALSTYRIGGQLKGMLMTSLDQYHLTCAEPGLKWGDNPR